MTESQQSFQRLLDIMNELREKCPWDKKQTLESIRPLTIEETYELSEAILSNDLPNVRKELGDLLLHIVFYAKIASETASGFVRQKPRPQTFRLARAFFFCLSRRCFFNQSRGVFGKSKIHPVVARSFDQG